MVAEGYRLGEELGRGALGRVVAVHAPDGSVQAGKILHVSHRNDPRAVQRFRTEARILADLDHPNLVRVHGLTEIDGEEVLCMERVTGGSLAERIAREGALAPERVVAIGRGIAAGLAAAHRAGLVHRDLKPHNVLLDGDGAAKIVDFGLARAASFAGIDRDAFAVAGTPDYMAPEALDPLAVDARSDLYALGCILYEAVAGRPPYTGATAFAILEAHRSAPVPTPPTPARELARVIQWLLAKSPADRPQSAAAVERAFEEVVQGTNALVPVAPASTATGQCPACGAPSVPLVPVCFDCGQSQVVLSPGRFTVFVVGPGAQTHKLDAHSRARLLDWLEANPTVGLDPAPLAKAAPRLPFVVVSGVDEASGAALVGALASLGFEAEVHEGGRFALEQVRRKAVTMSGRVAMVMGGSWWIVMQATKAVPILAVLGAAVVGTLAGGVHLAGRPAVRRRLGKTRAPELLAAPLARVAGVIPAIAEARHRESLRAVVQRALALHGAVGAADARQLEPELARVIDMAVVAAGRVDEIDGELAGTDLNNPTDDARARMQERDGCAARLLEAAALLDSLRARHAARAAGAGAAASLGELRALVEALEEVQAP